MSRLERWSRLKRGEAIEDVSSEAPDHFESDRRPPSAVAAAPQEAATGEPAPSEPGSLDHTLPDPDTLPPGSDIKAYLVSGVSAGLRKRALRRLFSASHYGVRDGLDDYDDDFREKLKPLADDVAERLRQWTRREPDDETTDEMPHEATQADSAPADVDQAADHGKPKQHDGATLETDDDDSRMRQDERVAERPSLDQGSVCKPRGFDQN